MTDQPPSTYHDTIDRRLPGWISRLAGLLDAAYSDGATEERYPVPPKDPLLNMIWNLGVENDGNVVAIDEAQAQLHDAGFPRWDKDGRSRLLNEQIEEVVARLSIPVGLREAAKARMEMLEAIDNAIPEELWRGGRQGSIEQLVSEVQRMGAVIAELDRIVSLARLAKTLGDPVALPEQLHVDDGLLIEVAQRLMDAHDLRETAKSNIVEILGEDFLDCGLSEAVYNTAMGTKVLQDIAAEFTDWTPEGEKPPEELLREVLRSRAQHRTTFKWPRYEARSNPLPHAPRHKAPWNSVETADLRSAWLDSRVTVTQLAIAHGRTTGAIIDRLRKITRLSTRQIEARMGDDDAWDQGPFSLAETEVPPADGGAELQPDLSGQRCDGGLVLTHTPILFSRQDAKCPLCTALLEEERAVAAHNKSEKDIVGLVRNNKLKQAELEDHRKQTGEILLALGTAGVNAEWGPLAQTVGRLKYVTGLVHNRGISQRVDDQSTRALKAATELGRASANTLPSPVEAPSGDLPDLI